MLTSKLYRLLSVACLGLHAVQLCCAIDIHHEQGEQTVTHCLRNCSHLSRQLIERKLIAKISSRQSCYEECLQKIGKHDILGYQQTKPLFKRIKRDASSTQASSKQYNESNGVCDYSNYNISYRGLHEKNFTVKFYNKTGRIDANITWTPPPETVNWTGYRIIYANKDFNQFNCTDVEKNVTSISVSYDWAIGDVADFQIVSLPQLEVNSSEHFIPHKVEISTAEYSTETTVKTEYSTETTVKTEYSTETTVKTERKTTSSSPQYSTKTTVKTENKTLLLIVAASAVAIFIVVAFVAVVVYCRFRRSKRYRTDTGLRQPGTEDQMTIEYDAFIIYSSEDKDWVINTLLSTLEQKHGLRCCVHYRDFIPGKAFVNNMADSVYSCRKTVAVVSHGFLKSKYCNSELEMALGRSLDRGDDSVVVIKLDDVNRKKLPKALQKKSYIDYPKWIERETWERKLVKCLKAPVEQTFV